MLMHRSWKRIFVWAVVAGLPVSLAAWTSAADGSQVAVTMYTTTNCACCDKWADHLRQQGFDVKTQPVVDLAPLRSLRGVPPTLAACHTAFVEGYVIEGHVPADVIRQMLEERPEATGIAVPRMPIGSPGMEQEGRRNPYNVVMFHEDGGMWVYARR